MPAHLASGGKAMLAALDDAEVRTLYGGAAPDSDGVSAQVDLDSLLAELRAISRRGYAVNREATERGVSAIGVCLKAVDGYPVAGLSIATPTLRFPRQLGPLYELLRSTAESVSSEITPIAGVHVS